MAKLNKEKLVKRTAAALCAAAIAVSALGLRYRDISLPDTDISDMPEKISASPAADTGYAQALNGGESDDPYEPDDKDGEDNGDVPPQESVRKSESAAVPPTDTAPEREYYYDSYSVTETTQTPQQGASSDGGESSSAAGGDRLTDDGSHADTPGNETTDGAQTDTEYFTTSITDGETVENEIYAFTITHLQKKLTVKRIEVKVNGKSVPWSGEVTLSSENGGENGIRVAVTYTDENGKVVSAYKTYTVFLRTPESLPDPEPQTPQLETDLTSHTRSDSRLEFFAYVSGEVSDVKLTVYHKNKKLRPDGEKYSCDLEMGINKIRIKAEFTFEGERQEIGSEYDVKLIAETTPETAPYLAYCNVPDTVRGTLFTLDLAPRDYNGNVLYYSNLFVRLNGLEIRYKWDGEYVSYLLELSAGENTLDIRVTDNEGRYTDYSYVITCLAAQDGEVIGCAVMELDANVLGLGTLASELNIEIRQGESAARSIVRALEENGFSVEGTGDLDSGYYLARLAKPGIAAAAKIDDTLRGFIESDSDVYLNDTCDPDSLGDRDFTSGSGWMICVNGHYTSYGTSDLHLKDGDVIRLRFTLAYGKDIGGYMNGDSNYDVCY